MSFGIYIHWPFCLSKCPYCDFNVHVRKEVEQDGWLVAYKRALAYYAQKLPDRTVASVFFGGGTPSLMEPETVAGILDEVQKLWPAAPDIEITMEANPTSVERGKFEAFRSAGVNRISLGVQALNDKDLQALGRKHSVAEARRAIQTAQDIFPRSSFDLIYARPDQSLEDWRAELSEAAKIAAGHLSLYQLTIERNTPFYFDHAQGKFQVPDQDLAADFYLLTQEVLNAAGLPAYEVSNHAAPGQESRHNLIYWHYEDYIGIGPGAHGRFTSRGKKWAGRDHPAPEIWRSFVARQEHGAHPFQEVAPKDRVAEALMMGLRLREGLPLERLSDAGGQDWRDFIDEKKLLEMRGQGWLKIENDQVIPNYEGWLRLNAIVPHVLK